MILSLNYNTNSKNIIFNKFLMLKIKSFINLKIKILRELRNIQAKPTYFIKNTNYYGEKQLCWTWNLFIPMCMNPRFNDIIFVDEINKNKILDYDIDDDQFMFLQEWIDLHHN